MTSQEIIKELKKHADPKNVAGKARFGITGKNVLGGPTMPELKKMAKRIKQSTDNPHAIALELWDSAIHEARLLAAFTDDFRLVTESQMEDWVKDFDSWDVCDCVCMHLFDKTPWALKKAAEWSNRSKEYEKRASFALMASLALQRHKTTNNELLKFLPIIKNAAPDERNFVKKAVNWALRQIGKRNNNLKREAIRTAQDILRIDSKAARWVANDALKELSSK